MYKDLAYYREIDLEHLGKIVKGLGGEKKASESYHDLINAIVCRCVDEMVEVGDLERYLGLPNDVKFEENREVWIYTWIGVHGEDRYESNTPFVVEKGIVRGTVKSLEDKPPFP